MIFGFEPFDLLFFVTVSLCICITVCTLAMEASVLFTPAFIFLFPFIIAGFPTLNTNEAIGLAITIEFFGYTSSVTGYWLRRQIDFNLAFQVLAITVPLAVAGRIAAYFVDDRWLLLIFGFVLLGLAAVIYRAYRGDVRHTCLLCGDSMAMKFSDQEEAPADEAPAVDGYVQRAHLFGPGDAHLATKFVFNAVDRIILCIGGAFGGLVGVAIGEISNTFLTVKKKVPVKVATGTSALVLHITILSALAANLAVLGSGIEVFDAQEIAIPWRIAFILAPVVIVGGQIGSFINSRLSDHALIRALMIAYVVVGVIVFANIVFA
jgi:uncharacterized membrane protein YfcA